MWTVTMFLVHSNIFWALATPNNTKYPFWGGIGFGQKFSHLPLLILISILHPNTPGGSTLRVLGRQPPPPPPKGPLANN